MAKRRKPIMLSAAAANAMIAIASAARNLPSGVPVKVCDSDAVKELDRAGLIERHHVGVSSIGAVPTALGKQFVQDAIRHLSN